MDVSAVLHSMKGGECPVLLVGYAAQRGNLLIICRLR